MASNKWDDDGSDSDTPPSSPLAPVQRRGKFDDEEQDSDVLESWDAAEDSEVEREKVKKEAEAKAKAEAAAKAAKKSRTQRVEEHKAANARRREELGDDYSSSEEEDEATRRAQLLQEQKEADLKHAKDLFGDMGIGNAGTGTRKTAKPVTTIADPTNPASTIELSSLKVFNPNTKDQFLALREALVPLLTANTKKAHYTIFMQEFVKQVCKDLPSDQIKKIASGLTTLSNEKMREEKAAEKGGKKKPKAKKTLNAVRDIGFKADTSVYDGDGLGDDDFM